MLMCILRILMLKGQTAIYLGSDGSSGITPIQWIFHIVSIYCYKSVYIHISHKFLYSDLWKICGYARMYLTYVCARQHKGNMCE